MGVIVNPALAGRIDPFSDIELDQYGSAGNSVTGTVAETVLRSIWVPPTILGPQSRIEVRPVWSFTNSANNKILAIKAGLTLGAAGTLYTRTRTTAAGEMPLIAAQFRGSLTSQLLAYSSGANYSFNTTAASVVSIDFSTGAFIFVLGTLSNTGETITLDGVQVKVCGPGRA